VAFQVRRVLTGHDASGKAIVTIDEVARHAFTGRPGATGINVWTTEARTDHLGVGSVPPPSRTEVLRDEYLDATT
jgi:hypothetical protein